MIKLLTFTTLYPNCEQPRHGIFVEQRLRHLVATGEVCSHVVAPVPWFPFRGARWGRYGVHAAVPSRETRYGIRIEHPRYPVIPKLGMGVAPRLLARAMAPVLRKIINQGDDFDVIDAHYFYPDGVAAVILGQRLGKPVVITARGSDINLIPHYAVARRQMLREASRARAMIAVSHALKNEMVNLGMAEDRIAVLRNGVDLDLFGSENRDRMRVQLGVTGRLLLSVGHLIEPKGHHLAIQALPRLPDATLMVVGDGEMKAELERVAAAAGVSDRVVFAGTVSQAVLRDYYAAADVLVLATRREGMPNVVLEALACGTPVVATAVGGIPEILSALAAGRLMTERSAEAVVAAVSALLREYPDRGATRQHAERFGWEETTQGQMDIFRRVMVDENRGAVSGPNGQRSSNA